MYLILNIDLPDFAFLLKYMSYEHLYYNEFVKLMLSVPERMEDQTLLLMRSLPCDQLVTLCSPLNDDTDCWHFVTIVAAADDDDCNNSNDEDDNADDDSGDEDNNNIIVTDGVNEMIIGVVHGIMTIR